MTQPNVTSITMVGEALNDIDDKPTGCYKHDHGGRGRKCALCPRMKEGNRFKSNFTGLSYKIRHNFTCKSKYVVYLIMCNNCGKQYTGKSINYMHIRHCGHRSEIENSSTELGVHFAACGLQIIDWNTKKLEKFIQTYHLCEGWRGYCPAAAGGSLAEPPGNI